MPVKSLHSLILYLNICILLAYSPEKAQVIQYNFLISYLASFAHFRFFNSILIYKRKKSITQRRVEVIHCPRKSLL